MNKQLLKYFLAKNYLTPERVCKELGISKSAYYNKMSGKAELKHSEIAILIGLCNMTVQDTWDVFFRRMK